MYILKLTYKQPLEVVELHLGAHRAYLDRLFAEGKLIATGPREPRVGGVILCNASTQSEVDAIIAGDPFCKADIADYELTQFHATKHSVSNFEAAFE